MHSAIVVGGALFQDIMSITNAGAGGEAGLSHAISGILSPLARSQFWLASEQGIG